MRSRAKTNARVLKSAALHWVTFYVFIHGTCPREAPDMLAAIKKTDRTALLDIVAVQCHGDEERACDLIEEIVRAPLHGDTLARRYVEFWAWIECGKEHTPYLQGALASSIRKCIRANVAGAA